MGFAKIVDSDYYPAASLGGLTNGVTTVEMASAFAAIENDGVFREPTCISKITDSEGKTIVNNKKNRKEKHVYKQNAARMMTSILQGVLVSGTARGNALDNMSCAGKTGTTSDKKDGWFCGYTPYYTTAVWVGRDDNRIMESLSGASYPKSIWSNFMNAIHSEYSSTDSMGGNYTDYQGETTQQTGTQATTATESSTKGTEATTAAPTTAAPTTAAPTTAAPTTAAQQTEEQPAENQ